MRGTAGVRRAQRFVLVALLGCLAGSGDPAGQEPQSTFRSNTSIISVDVVVRDASGNPVRGLTEKDFTVLEDGRPQQIQTFAFEEITNRPAPAIDDAGVLANLEERLEQDVRRAPGATAAVQAAPAQPMTSATFAGRRLVVLLFDVSSMEPVDVQRAVDSALEYVRGEMDTSDLVSVVTIGSTLTVLSDFTSVREEAEAALGRLAYTEGTATPPPDAQTAATDEAEAETDGDAAADASGFEAFNNDVRLRALKTLADTLAPIEQKKAILYFSAGMARSGEDNQVELRAAINAAVRGNVAIYPVDSRGLQALPPGGDASRASGRGVGLFSGRNVQQQFANLSRSQDTLTTLAADTGGRAFTDSNAFGDAFRRVQRDLSSYYLLGYASTNPAQDGRFRRIQVRVSRPNVRVEARAGYYAPRDFRNTTGRDREAQLEEQLAAAVSATDIPVVVGSGWFREAENRFYVPIALAIPGSAVPVAEGATKVTIDVRGLVRDEQGRTLSRIRQTLDIPNAPGAATLAGRQVLYQSGVVLPPGRFSVKVVVRENTSGAIGSFEAPILVPQLRGPSLKMSSVVFSTQLQQAAAGRSGGPLVRDGVQLLPNLTRVVGRQQKIYFYYEVYDPGLADEMPEMRTSLAFYRGSVKVYETPLVERTAIDEPGRRSVVFRFEVPAEAFTPGTYTCQVNVIDAVAGQFAFPRLNFMVRP